MKTQKGSFEFGDVFMIAIFVLMMVIMMYIFQPFAGILGTQMENQTNGGIVMTLIYLLPVVVVGFFIWGMANKIKSPPSQPY
ncbi:hypothetical protein KBH77_01460 [Patescibacteria group bacterium]|jgi:heme/copper-type cytochrome/quinol oxidase subunit 2|nr:hypothetical protein [Patescibacteria group bacterium]